MTKNKKLVISEANSAFDLIAQKHKLKHTKVRGIDAAVIRLARNYMREGKVWHFAHDFIGLCRGGDNIWGSYKAPASISDVWKQYPHLVEMRKIGIQSLYRLRIENITPALLGEMQKVTYRLP